MQKKQMPKSSRTSSKMSTASKQSGSKKAPAKKSSGANKSFSPKSASVAVDKDSSISVREIENGYIVSESGTTGKGKNQKWYNKDYYSPNNPIHVSVPNKSGLRFGNKK